MSEENKLPEKLINDMSQEDLGKIQKFIEDGLPGLSKIDDQTLYRMTDLYLSGSTYRQIARSLNVSKALVLYVSKTYGWQEARQEYMHELNVEIKNRILDSKLVSQDFLLLVIQAYQKKIGLSLRKYLATDDPSHTQDIDLKEIDKLLKTIETLKNLTNENNGSKNKTPAIGLNLGDGITVERSGDNKVTITPKEKTLGDMLKKFADVRRAEVNKDSKNEVVSDIVDEEVTKIEE